MKFGLGLAPGPLVGWPPADASICTSLGELGIEWDAAVSADSHLLKLEASKFTHERC